LTLNPGQAKKLRSLAHHLDPVVWVGKQGVTPALIEKVDQSLNSHELIKIRFLEYKEKKRELAEEIAQQVNGEIAGVIGHILILFRRHEDPEQRKIRLE
jgi:RNA-binding protein